MVYKTKEGIGYSETATTRNAESMSAILWKKNDADDRYLNVILPEDDESKAFANDAANGDRSHDDGIGDE